MKSDPYGIASRAKGSDHDMRNLASRTPVGSITKIPWEEALAAVGKPYELPCRSTVCRDFLVSERALWSPEMPPDSASDCRGLFDLSE